MELTLESAFSTGGIIGNLSYILLIVSMAMRRIFWLRSLAIVSGLTGIAYDLFWLNNPVGVFWETLFTVTNLVQWLLLIRDDNRMKLTDQERVIWQDHFANLSSKECKQLLSNSEQVLAQDNQVVIREGEKVSSIYFVLEGQIDITLDGEKVSECGPGDLLGEMSFLTGQAASADSIARQDSQLLKISQEQLATLVKAQPEFGFAITNHISLNMAAKLSRQNRVNRSAPIS